MKRIAIIIVRNLNKGETSNVAAILMGQAALQMPDIYDVNPVKDSDGQLHAAIRFSVVVLEANSTESLVNFARRVKSEFPTLISFHFTKTGQQLNNAFAQYQAEISGKSTESLEPLGVIIVGDDAIVRQATKKFSLSR